MALLKWASSDLQSTSEWDANQVGAGGGVIDFADTDTDSDIVAGFARARLIGGGVSGSWLELDLGGNLSALTSSALYRTDGISSAVVTTVMEIVAAVGGTAVTVDMTEVNAGSDLRIRLLSGANVLATHTHPRAAFTSEKNWVYVEVSLDDGGNANKFKLYTEIIAQGVGSSSDRVQTTESTSTNVVGSWQDSRVVCSGGDPVYVRQHIIDSAYGVTKWRPPGFLTPLVPDGDITIEWDVTGAVVHYEATDDHVVPSPGPNDGDTSYISTATTGETDRLTLQNIAAPTAGGVASQVSALAIRAWARNAGTLPTGDVNFRCVTSANALVFQTGNVQPGVTYSLHSAFNEAARTKATVDGYRIECVSSLSAQEAVRVTALVLEAFVDGSATQSDPATGTEPATENLTRGPDPDSATGTEPTTENLTRGPDPDSATGTEPATERIERANEGDSSSGAEPANETVDRTVPDSGVGTDTSGNISPDFDGSVTDYAVVPNTSTLDFGSAATIEFWMRAGTQLATFRSLLTKVSGGVGWNVGTGGATVDPALRIRLDTSGGSNQVTTIASSGIFDGQPTHIAITLDAGVIKAYVDGVEVVSGTYNHGSGFGVATSMVLAATAVGQDPKYAGRLWDLRYWSVARSAAQIAASMDARSLTGAEAGLALWLPMWEGQGTTLRDYGPNAIDTPLQADVAWIIEGDLRHTLTRGPDPDTATGDEPATENLTRGPDPDTATGDEPAAQTLDRTGEPDTAAGDEPATEALDRAGEPDSSTGAEANVALEHGPDPDSATGAEPGGDTLDRDSSDPAAGNEPGTDALVREESDQGEGADINATLEHGPDLDDSTGAEAGTDTLVREESDSSAGIETGGDTIEREESDPATADEVHVALEHGPDPDSATGVEPQEAPGPEIPGADDAAGIEQQILERDVPTPYLGSGEPGASSSSEGATAGGEVGGADVGTSVEPGSAGGEGEGSTAGFEGG